MLPKQATLLSQPEVSLRPERVLLLERLVRDELTLQRHLAAGRRAASARMSLIRQACAAPLRAVAVAASRRFKRETA